MGESNKPTTAGCLLVGFLLVAILPAILIIGIGIAMGWYGLIFGFPFA